jgi:hypothetical protein
VLSALVLAGGVVGPSSALAAGGNDNRWIAVEDHFAVVMPNGETFTEDNAPMDETDLPPVGSRLFISEVLHETKDGETPGAEVGRSHIECTAQVAPGFFRCDAAFVFDSGSQLLASVAADFGTEETGTFHLDVPVTGGSGDYFGATGVVSLTDITDPNDPGAASTTLYEADITVTDHG